MQTGKASHAYKYFPVVDIANQRVDESHWAAYAAECANEQGKFWDYHDLLFVRWKGEFAGTFTKSKLKNYAAELALDTAKFNACLDTEKTKPIIDADIAEARRLGLPGTPIFLLNGRQMALASLEFPEFQRAFDLILK